MRGRGIVRGFLLRGCGADFRFGSKADMGLVGAFEIIYRTAFLALWAAPLWRRGNLVDRLGARLQLGPSLLSSLCSLCLFIWPVSVRSRSCSNAGLFESDRGLAFLCADVLDPE